MKRKVLNKILKNPMSITGNADWDAQLNALLYDDDIEYVKQGLGIADAIGVDVLEKAVGEMIKSNVYNIIQPTMKNKLITLTLLQLQESNEQPFSFWKHFTKLDLSDIDMTELPDSIGNLKNLERLDLRRNDLTYLPDSIGKLKKLRELELSNNNLRELPNSIGYLKNIKKLNLMNNNLIELPDSIGNLKNLEMLVLYNNNLRELPDSIGNLKNLISLSLLGINISSKEKQRIQQLLPKTVIV